MIAIHVVHAGVVIRSNPILNIDLLLVPVCPVLNQEKEKKPTLGKKQRGGFCCVCTLTKPYK